MPQFKKYKLGELIDVQNGYAFKSEDLKSFGIPIIKIKNIQPPNISFEEADYYPHELNGRLNQFLVKKKDILISMTGSHVSQIASAVGRVGRYGFDKPALINQRVGKLYSKDTSKLNNDYLYYFIARPEIQFELATNAGGSANQANISPQDIKDLEIELPDIKTQTRIASILSSLDDKIELNRRTNHTLEQIAQTLFKKYFDLPAVASAKAGDDIDPENLPEGWRWGRLDEEYDIIMGQSPEGSSYNEAKIGTPFFQGRTDFDFKFPSFRIYTTSPKRFAKKFDILLSVRAPVGDLNLALTDCCIGRGIASLRHKKSKLSYGYYKLKTMNDAFEPFNGEGTVFGSINKDELAKISVIIPSDKKIEEYNNVVSPMDDKIHQLYNETNSLTKIRDSLLPKLMSGEIEVNALEKELVN